jgi:prolyl oligopeptidase
MPELMTRPPCSPIDTVTDILHGVPVPDPYRWLEDQDSPRTRAWIEEQTHYARAYLDFIPGRHLIRQRIHEFLAVETYDSVLPSRARYIFRKRLPGQEQPCICMRDGSNGEDQILINPVDRGTGNYTAIKPLKASPDGRLLLYEVKQGGERSGNFELFDIESRKKLPDALPHGYLRGFAFAPDCKSFYYIHEGLEPEPHFPRAAYHHVLGTSSRDDREVFSAEDDEKLRLSLTSDGQRLGFVVSHFLDKTYTDFYVKPFASTSLPQAILTRATYVFVPLLLNNRIFAITDLAAPNLRIVEAHFKANAEPRFVDVVPARDLRIQRYLVAGEYLAVSYVRGTRTEVLVYDLQGKRIGELEVQENETVRLLNGSEDSEDILFEAESFAEPTRIFRYLPSSGRRVLWASKASPFDAEACASKQVWYRSKDGTKIPMFLFGQKDVLESGSHPAIMTSYGGFGVPMTPQFSVFVAFLVERGCLFALPNIRGGSEFGHEWHEAAKRRNRQTAYDDFLAAAEWLVENGRTIPETFAIFGGSNSGLLVGAALTQRPDLFRAVLCMVPMLDMLRYHLFDNAHTWKEEFGTAEDCEDFAVLAKYSPYHRVCDGVAYPAVMLVSGDADRNCNPLHARKMTARLQTANVSDHPILIAYNKLRGHSPVLPLTERIDALTDRMAFLCDQLGISV